MAALDTKAVLNEYIEQHPVARKAALRNDPFFKAQMETLRRALALLETALRAEGLGPDACRRIVNTVVYGSPEAEVTIRRMADHEAQVELLTHCPCGHPLGGDYMCLNSRIYGPCGNEYCTGACDDTHGYCTSDNCACPEDE